MSKARNLLRAEMRLVGREQAGDEEEQEEQFAQYGQLLESMSEEVLYLPEKKRYGRASLHSKQDAIAAAEHEHRMLREHMGKGLKKALKLEKKLTIVLGGYSVREGGGRGGEGGREGERADVALVTLHPLHLFGLLTSAPFLLHPMCLVCRQQRARALHKAIAALDSELKEASLEQTAFEKLREQEQAAIPARRAALAEEVEAQERRQSELQRRYKELTQRLQQAQEA